MRRRPLTSAAIALLVAAAAPGIGSIDPRTTAGGTPTSSAPITVAATAAAAPAAQAVPAQPTPAAPVPAEETSEPAAAEPAEAVSTDAAEPVISTDTAGEAVISTDVAGTDVAGTDVEATRTAAQAWVPTAAAAKGWGTPLPASDEFNYTGAPDTTKWTNVWKCVKGNAGKGLRCPENSTVADGYLRQTGEADGTTGWMGNKASQKYGRWEVRMRVKATATAGRPYHPVLLLWPKDGKWPSGGEYDFAETDVGDAHVNFYVHHPTVSGVVQDDYSHFHDITQWHTYAIDWAPGHVRGYIDGVLWFDNTDRAAQAPGPMYGAIQLDNTTGWKGLQPAVMDVDWYRVYAPS